MTIASLQRLVNINTALLLIYKPNLYVLLIKYINFILEM